MRLATILLVLLLLASMGYAEIQCFHRTWVMFVDGPPVVEFGQTAPFRITVMNEGNCNEMNLPFAIAVNGQKQGDMEIPHIGPGERETLDYMWIPHKPGNHTITVSTVSYKNTGGSIRDVFVEVLPPGGYG